jgi:hypothetical protein
MFKMYSIPLYYVNVKSVFVIFVLFCSVDLGYDVVIEPLNNL